MKYENRILCFNIPYYVCFLLLLLFYVKSIGAVRNTEKLATTMLFFEIYSSVNFFYEIGAKACFLWTFKHSQLPKSHPNVSNPKLSHFSNAYIKGECTNDSAGYGGILSLQEDSVENYKHVIIFTLVSKPK